VTFPAALTITTTSGDPLLLHWVQLRNENVTEPTTEQVDAYCLARSAASLSDQGLDQTLQWFGPKSQKIPGLLEVSIRKATDNTQPPAFARWTIDEKLRDARIFVDKAKGLLQLFSSDPSDSPLEWKPQEGDGDYIVDVRSVFAEANGEALRLEPWSEIMRFAIGDGKVIDIQAQNGALPRQYVATDTWHMIDAAFGDVAKLRGYSINTDVIRTDRAAEASFYWDVPKGFARDWNISLQLVDAQGKLWSEKVTSLKDALAFQDSWSEAEILRTDFALPVDRTVPEGQYNLRLQMYYSYSADMLPVKVPGREPSNSLLLGPYTVKTPVYLQGR
jgi:hypothetical protein